MFEILDCKVGRVNNYISVPVEIEAVKWCGWNAEEICEWSGGAVCQQISCGGWPDDLDILLINTLEGTMKANLGDFIIKGVLGEFYPCKPAAFYKKYIPLKCVNNTNDTVESEVDD